MAVRIHPTAEVSPEAEIGEGTSVWHYVQVRERVKIGRNCILGKGVYVDFDVTIGDNCKLQNGVFVYHPATLVKDAQRHGVRVQPIDVTRSNWACTLEDKETVRLGLRYVQGLRKDGGERVQKARAEAPFASPVDFERRVRLGNTELATLAELGAFASLGHTRRQALWQVSRLRERTEGLLGRADPRRSDSPLPEMLSDSPWTPCAPPEAALALP